MDERNHGRSADPARGQEGACVDLVDDDVEPALTDVLPETARGPVDAEPTAPPDDVNAVLRLLRLPAGDCGGEERDLVATRDESFPTSSVKTSAPPACGLAVSFQLRIRMRISGPELRAASDEVRDRARAIPSLEPVTDVRDHPRGPVLARLGDEIGCGDGVVEEQVPTRGEERCPALEVGAHALLAVVAVDEEEVDGLRRRLCRTRVRDVQPHALGEAVALERRCELARRGRGRRVPGASRGRTSARRRPLAEQTRSGTCSPRGSVPISTTARGCSSRTSR